VFSIYVVDGCNPPDWYESQVVLTAVPLENQMYTITKTPKTYSMPKWSVSPSYCDDRIVYSVSSVSPSIGISAVSLNGRTFSFSHTTSLSLTGGNIAGVPYNIMVLATLGTRTATQSFTLNIKNPCLDPTMLTVVAEGAVPDIDYQVGSQNQNTWTHSGFIINASSTVRNLCGDLSYTSNEGVLDSYVTYTGSSRTFAIFTDSSSLIEHSPYAYTVSAELAMFPGYGKATDTGLITIKNQCGNAFQPYTGEVPSIFYNYSPDAPAEFLFPTQMIAPSLCLNYATFKCQYLEGNFKGLGDPCSYIKSTGQYSTTSTFDGDIGRFSFMSSDTSMFPPGQYMFRIAAEIEGNVQAVTFYLHLIDPCPLATLSVLQNPFEGHHEYVLRDSALTFNFDKTTIGGSSSGVFCGAPKVAIVTGSGATSIDDLFTMDNVNGVFSVGPNTNILKAGEYSLRFKFYYANAADNFVASPVFVITIIDGCNPPAGYN
jgi:hypothetical protein